MSHSQWWMLSKFTPVNNKSHLLHCEECPISREVFSKNLVPYILYNRSSLGLKSFTVAEKHISSGVDISAIQIVLARGPATQRPRTVVSATSFCMCFDIVCMFGAPRARSGSCMRIKKLSSPHPEPFPVIGQVRDPGTTYHNKPAYRCCSSSPFHARSSLCLS